MKTLGKLKSADLSFISDARAHQYASELQSKDKKISFSKEFPLTNTYITEVLQKMLEFNPYFRSNAKELLAHKIFDSCRSEYPGCELDAEWKIELECDAIGMYDYEKDDFGKVTFVSL